MSASPIGKNRKAMWQSLVLVLSQRLPPEAVSIGELDTTISRIANAADAMLAEMGKRFPGYQDGPPQPENKPKQPTITYKR